MRSRTEGENRNGPPAQLSCSFSANSNHALDRRCRGHLHDFEWLGDLQCLAAPAVHFSAVDDAWRLARRRHCLAPERHVGALARTIHLTMMALIVGFLIIHLALVILFPRPVVSMVVRVWAELDSAPREGVR